MRPTCQRRSRSIACCLLALSFSLASAATPEGRWKLVEQRYEQGSANLASAERPVRLELFREGLHLAGKIWAGDDRSLAVPWPAFVSDAGPKPVQVIELSGDVAASTGEASTVSAHYRVRPSAEDDLVLDIVERYEVADDGLSMTGTMSVTFTGGQTHRGGFLLHRRFEKEP